MSINECGAIYLHIYVRVSFERFKNLKYRSFPNHLIHVCCFTQTTLLKINLFSVAHTNHP